MTTSGKSRLHGLSMQSGLTRWGRAGAQSGVRSGSGPSVGVRLVVGGPRICMAGGSAW